MTENSFSLGFFSTLKWICLLGPRTGLFDGTPHGLNEKFVLNILRISTLYKPNLQGDFRHPPYQRAEHDRSYRREGTRQRAVHCPRWHRNRQVWTKKKILTKFDNKWHKMKTNLINIVRIEDESTVSSVNSFVGIGQLSNGSNKSANCMIQLN